MKVLLYCWLSSLQIISHTVGTHSHENVTSIKAIVQCFCSVVLLSSLSVFFFFFFGPCTYNQSWHLQTSDQLFYSRCMTLVFLNASRKLFLEIRVCTKPCCQQTNRHISSMRFNTPVTVRNLTADVCPVIWSHIKNVRSENSTAGLCCYMYHKFDYNFAYLW